MTEHVLHESGPGSLIIPGPGGEPLLTIRGDGEWVVADVPDAAKHAAAAFVEWVSHYRPDAAVARVRALHTRMGEAHALCRECCADWPCLTIRALNGDTGAGT